MKHLSVPGVFAVCLYLGLIAPSNAADPTPADATSSSDKKTTSKLAEKCVADLGTFSRQMEKDGYWLSGSNYAFGYGYGYPMGDYPATVTGYHNARPGHEVRVLIASATILAGQGLQQPCEEVRPRRGPKYLQALHGGSAERQSSHDGHIKLAATRDRRREAGYRQ